MLVSFSCLTSHLIQKFYLVSMFDMLLLFILMLLNDKILLKILQQNIKINNIE